eukprot:scaffold13276_cov151-Amphora_coffeaeformis.AAC.3
MVPNANEILKLNVGGKHFITTRTTLASVKDSMLAKLFAAFGILLDYLRDGCRLLKDASAEILPRLRADAGYFGLQNLVKYGNYS